MKNALSTKGLLSDWVVVPNKKVIDEQLASFSKSPMYIGYSVADKICKKSKTRFKEKNPFKDLPGVSLRAEFVPVNDVDSILGKKKKSIDIIYAGYHGLALALAQKIKLPNGIIIGTEELEYSHIIPVTNSNKNLKDFGKVVKYIDPLSRTIQASTISELKTDESKCYALVFKKS